MGSCEVNINDIAAGQLSSFLSLPRPTLGPNTLATALRPVVMSSSRAGRAVRQCMPPGLRLQAYDGQQLLRPLAV